MKRALVWALWHVCGIIDKLPGPVHSDDGWYLTSHAHYGCYPLGLSSRACALEVRWGLL